MISEGAKVRFAMSMSGAMIGALIASSYTHDWVERASSSYAFALGFEMLIDIVIDQITGPNGWLAKHSGLELSVIFIGPTIAMGVILIFGQGMIAGLLIGGMIGFAVGYSIKTLVKGFV